MLAAATFAAACSSTPPAPPPTQPGFAADSPARAVDPSLVINGQSLVVSNGEVFFRTSEAAMAP